ncbi:site-specific integrase [Bacillus sp. NP157]|nr:site-specific integrase [Bacillus sp. NP157]
MTSKKPKAERREPGVYLREDGSVRYEVKIRWKGADGKTTGLPTTVFPFDPKARPSDPTSRKNALDSANLFAIQERSALRLYRKPRAQLSGAWTLGQLLHRVIDEVEAEKKALAADGKKLGKSGQQRLAYARMLTGQASSQTSKNKGFPDLCALNLRKLKPEHFGGARNSLASRLLGRDGKQAPAESIRRVIGFLSQTFQHARKHWEIDCVNPLEKWKALDLPPTGQGRERTLTAIEWTHIQEALADALPTTRAAVYTARFSAARRGEVVKLDWSDLKLEDPDKATALLRDTKSRHKNRAGVAPRNRTIPLPPHLAHLLLDLRAERGGKHAKGAVFTGDTGQRLAPDSITQAWARACRRAGVEGARLHDLRHTRITELGHALKNPLQVAAISGHDDLGVLKRYFNATAEDLATVLNRLEGERAAATRIEPGTAYSTAVDALAALPEQEALMALMEATRRRNS